jgi:leucine dehydrogenase
VRRGPRSGLPTIVAVHSTARGPSLGGCRLWRYDHVQLAIADALRLAEAMTYKAAVAGLPLGGGKGVIMVPDADALARRGARTAVLRDFAETVDALAGAYVTAEDVGTSERDMRVIAEGTPHVSGLSRRRGGSGDPSPWTALGVQVAMEVACERALGSASLRGRTVVVSGLGHVGLALARLCARAGTRLVVSDIDAAKRAVADGLGARWVEPDDAIAVPADVFAPCALGGVLAPDTIERLGAPVVAGAANNQLAGDEVAGLLAARGVLWVPDFVANAGGIINIAVELRPGGYDPRQAREDVRGVAATVRRVLDDAERDGVTPLQAALALAAERLAEAGAPRRAPRRAPTMSTRPRERAPAAPGA